MLLVLGGSCHLFFKKLGEHLLLLVVLFYVCPPSQMDDHLPGVSMRRDERSFPMSEYRQTARRTAEYRLVGGGTAECRQPAGGLARGGGGGDRATSGGGGRICDEKVGFACSLADRAGLSPFFSRPESPNVP
jgi:hypothetical protein